MRVISTIFLFFISSLAFSQVKLGVELGGGFSQHIDSISYTNKVLSPLGNIGLNVEIPLYKNLIALETGLLLYDHYYKISGPKIHNFYVSYPYSSGFRLAEKINDFGIVLPLRFIFFPEKRINPFIGGEINISLNSNNFLDDNLYGIGLGSMDNIALGKMFTELSSFTWNLCGGLYYRYSPTIKYRLQYAMGMNNFVTATFTERIINDVVIDPPYTDKSRVHQLKLAVVYSPDWKKIKEKRTKKRMERTPLNERLKAIYQ